MPNVRQMFVVVLLLGMSVSAIAKDKNITWNTGKVLDTQRNRYFAGTLSSHNESGNIQANGTSNTYGSMTNTSATGTYSGSSYGSNTAVYRVFEDYVIDGGSEVFLVEERLRFRWSHPANLTVNGPVKFYVKGRKLHILDDDGKEHTTEIMRKTLKQ